MAQGGDILVGEQGSQLIAALEREHARERIELVGAREFAVGGGGEGGPGHQTSPISQLGRPENTVSAGLSNTVDKRALSLHSYPRRLSFAEVHARRVSHGCTLAVQAVQSEVSGSCQSCFPSRTGVE